MFEKSHSSHEGTNKIDKSTFALKLPCKITNIGENNVQGELIVHMILSAPKGC